MQLEQLRLGFLCSHNGSTMQAIVEACVEGRLSAKPAVVISNNSGSFAVQRAKQMGIPSFHLSSKAYPKTARLDQKISETLANHNVNLVILAGYMRLLGPITLGRYKNRILNTHPSLLPNFGGKGMYGKFVHEAVLASENSVTGATIHLVNEQYDKGAIIAQVEIPILDGDSTESLMERVRQQERKLYVTTLQQIANGHILLD